VCRSEVDFRPAHDAATDKERQLPEFVLTQFVSPDDEHDMLETCRELKIKIKINSSKELCLTLVIYPEFTIRVCNKRLDSRRGQRFFLETSLSPRDGRQVFHRGQGIRSVGVTTRIHLVMKLECLEFIQTYPCFPLTRGDLEFCLTKLKNVR
jgi:hypothetical protein